MNMPIFSALIINLFSFNGVDFWGSELSFGKIKRCTIIADLIYALTAVNYHISP